MTQERKDILSQLWKEQDKAYSLMNEYDSMPHHYGDKTLYQAEAYIVSEIGNKPSITITELAAILNKTTSACSQLVKKLITKGLVLQVRNESNRRIYNLELTEAGKKLHLDHMEFNHYCQIETFLMLESFTDEELETHIRVQRAINQAYTKDVERSRAKYGTEK